MKNGVSLVRAHFESLVAGRVDDFNKQLTPDFRYSYLPPILGAGPAQARRWRNILFSIYRDWEFSIVDSHAKGEDIALRVDWRGTDPVEPENTAPEFFDSVSFRFIRKGDKLKCCDAIYMTFEDHIGQQGAPI